MAGLSAAERRSALADLSTLALRDLVVVWRRASQANTVFAAFIMDAYPEIATTYAATASHLAADWYETAASGLAYRAVSAETAPVDALRKSAHWALGAHGKTALTRMSGTLQRTVFNGARDTTIFNAGREHGARWAREASAGACAFCRMMTIRGAVYHHEGSASFEAHDHCHCVAIEVRPGETYGPPEHATEWQTEYEHAREAADSGSAKAILSAWRQLDK